MVHMNIIEPYREFGVITVLVKREKKGFQELVPVVPLGLMSQKASLLVLSRATRLQLHSCLLKPGAIRGNPEGQRCLLAPLPGP